MSVGLAVTIFLFAWLSGLEAWAYYHWTRWSLARKKLLPLRLRAFLDWAAQDTGILRASDSYEFRHRELLEYLARGVYPVGAVNVSWEESRRATDPATGSGQVAHPAQAKTTSRREEEEERLRRRIADRQAAVDQDGTDPKARSELANVFHQAGNPLAALEHIRRATLLEPDNARHLADYAQILDSLGKGNEALDLLSSATHPSPQDGAHLRSLRAAVVKNQRSREARIELAAGRTHAKPDDPWAWWNLSVAWRMAGDPSRAAEARRRCVALADDLDAQEIGRLAWRLNSRGYSKDAVAVAQSLPGKDRRRQAQILGHAYGDLNEFIQADRCLREVEESAVSAEILNALANLLITRGRWADAATAAEQAQSKEPAELAFDFTLAEARLASGDLDSARAALAFALDKARRDESRSAGDPAWLCRILWQYNAFPRPGQAIEMVIEEFHARGLDHALAEGLITATPISQDQSGWSPSRLPEWCFHWGRHRQLRAAVGIVQRLADEAAAGSRVPA
jgi:tetratricopeptide (TPR) repeat protein